MTDSIDSNAATSAWSGAPIALFAAQPLAAFDGDLLECPCWDARTETLLFVDIRRGMLCSFKWATQRFEETWIDSTVSAAVPRMRGGVVVAAQSGLMVQDVGEPTLMLPLEPDADRTRPNDAKCDPAGRLWVGTMADDGSPSQGTLYRVRSDWTCEAVLSGVTISNGLGWSSDGTLMYYIDSIRRTVDVLDFDLTTGAASNRRTLIDTASIPGLPDGMTTDEEGCLWVAFYGGSSVRRFAPDGSWLATVTVDAPLVTSCAFAGPRLDHLVITTARDESRRAALFVAEPGVVGAPPHMFAG